MRWSAGTAYRQLRHPLRHVGALVDAAALQPSRTGRNHLLWLARSQELPAGRVDEVIELVGLASAARRKAGGYSLGMRQRLGIAAAMLGDPPVLILDEPFNGMDPEGIIWIRGFLRSLAAEGRAVLVSSHLMGELQDIADQVVVVGRGRVLADASVEELLAGAARRPGPAAHAGASRGGRRACRRGEPRRRSPTAARVTVAGIAAQRVVEMLGRGGRRVLRGHRPAGEPRGRLPPAHRRRDRVPGRRGRAGCSDEPSPAPRRAPTRRAGEQQLAVGAARGVGQVPHRPRLAHRPGPRRALLCVAVHVPRRQRQSRTASAPAAGDCTAGHPFVPTGPDGEAVADSYQFVARPLTGNGTLTAQITSLTGLISTGPTNVKARRSRTASPGLAAWAKAGILLTPSTRQGSAYAAVMATGSHGIRFQYDYTHDHRRPAGRGHDATPRWLRLTRAGDTITGYDSTDGAPLAPRSAPPACPACRPPSGRAVRHLTGRSFQTAQCGVPDPGHRDLRPPHPQRRTGAPAAWHGQSIGTGRRTTTRRSAPAAPTTPAAHVVVSGSGTSPPPSSTASPAATPRRAPARSGSSSRSSC